MSHTAMPSWTTLRSDFRKWRFFLFCKQSGGIDVSVVHHASLLVIPIQASRKNLKCTSQVLRASKVANFVNKLSRRDWSFVKNESLDKNEKFTNFHNVPADVFSESIPAKFVNFTDNTKPWITP